MDFFRQVGDDGHEVLSQYAALVAAINLQGLTTFDLLNFANSADRSAASSRLAKRLGRSIREIDSFLDHIKARSEAMLTPGTVELDNECVPTGLALLDARLGGGIVMGEVSEVFGASGTGKSQFLLHILAEHLRNRQGKCVYISTEAPIETRRLESMMSASMDNIFCIYCPDLESQDHIIQTQLPVLLDEHDEIELVIIDSISHHLRREDALTNVSYLSTKIATQEQTLLSLSVYKNIKSNLDQQHNHFFKSNPMYRNTSSRNLYVISLHRQLQMLATLHSVAVVVSNQVSDSFDKITSHDETAPLDYEYQLGFIAGWDHQTILRYLQVTHPSSASSNSEVYSRLMQTLQQDLTKRSKIDNANYNPRDEATFTEHQLQLIDQLHRENTIKRYLPTLGYTWSRRISTRILLIKTYRPTFVPPAKVDRDTGLTYDQLDANYEVLPGNHSNKRKVDSERVHYKDGHVALSDLVTGWNLERHMRVVTSSCGHLPGVLKNISFTINNSGLKEV